MLPDIGPVEIDGARDQASALEPKIVCGWRRTSGVDDLVLSLAAKGLATFRPEIRTVIRMTSAIGSLNARFRRNQSPGQSRR